VNIIKSIGRLGLVDYTARATQSKFYEQEKTPLINSLTCVNYTKTLLTHSPVMIFIFTAMWAHGKAQTTSLPPFLPQTHPHTYSHKHITLTTYKPKNNNPLWPKSNSSHQLHHLSCGPHISQLC